MIFIISGRYKEKVTPEAARRGEMAKASIRVIDYLCEMDKSVSNNPMHGITLKKILEDLVEFYGFDTLGELVKIRCFNHDPSIKSSLAFLRKTEWARKEVEELYIRTLPKLR